jgi:hypothetical protein
MRKKWLLLSLGFVYTFFYESGGYNGTVKAKETKKLDNLFPDFPRARNALVPIIGKKYNEIVYFNAISYDELEKLEWRITISSLDKEKANKLLNEYVDKFVDRLKGEEQEKIAFLFYFGDLEVTQELNELYNNDRLSGEVLEKYVEYLNGKKTWDKFLEDLHSYAAFRVYRVKITRDLYNKEAVKEN